MFADDYLNFENSEMLYLVLFKKNFIKNF